MRQRLAECGQPLQQPRALCGCQLGRIRNRGRFRATVTAGKIAGASNLPVGAQWPLFIDKWRVMNPL